jgi:hypothetical protein
MNRHVEISREIVKVIEGFPKIHKFLISGDTGCHPQHLVDTIADKLAVRENILVGIGAELKVMLDEAQAKIDGLSVREEVLTGAVARLKGDLDLTLTEIERLKQYTDPKLFAAASTVLEVAGKGSDEEVDLALVMLEEAVKWWDKLPWQPGDAGIKLPKYEE